MSEKKEEGFNLPGAVRFTQYMREKVKGTLSATGPEIVDNSYNGKYGKEWIVYLEGKEIGRYCTLGRQYSGRIPGYINDAEVVGNKHRENKTPIDTASLIHTPWQRQDGHSEIVFP